MLKQLATLIATASILASLATAAFAKQQIGWRDLTIPVDPQEDPYFALDFERRTILEELLSLERLRDSNGELPERAKQRMAEIQAELAASGLDGKALIEKEQAFRSKIIAQRSSVRSEWDGMDIRIPGYMLPLEYDGDQIVEFLLVPYAGACVHTPPPPANQIIHVRANMGFVTNGLFTPVWVTGKLSIESSQQSAGMSDGTTGFEVGYALNATEVVEYKQ